LDIEREEKVREKKKKEKEKKYSSFETEVRTNKTKWA